MMFRRAGGAWPAADGAVPGIGGGGQTIGASGQPVEFRDGDETQRAHYTARRKEVWEALHPEPSVDYGREDGGEAETEVAQVAPPQFAGQLGGARPQTKGFAASTAEVTGESKRAINLNVARAEAIGDDLLRLKGTSLDKGVEPPPCKRYSRGALRHGAMRAR